MKDKIFSFICISFFILNSLDLLSTLRFMNDGYLEGNPLFAYLFNHYFLFAVFLKILGGFYVMYLSIKLYDLTDKYKRIAFIILILFICSYTYLVFNNYTFY